MTALFAQDPAPAPKTGPQDLGPFGGGLPLLMIGGLALFWVVVVLPADRRRRKEAAQLLADLRPGKKVATSGGIVGTVITAKDGDEEVTLRSADSKIRVLRSTITRVLGDDAPGDAAK